MGCNCKNTTIESNVNLEDKKEKKVINTILNFISFLFIFTLTIPLIIPFIGYILFKTMVLNNGEINISSLFFKLGKKIFEEKDNDNDDDEDDYELYESDDYELTEYDDVNKDETNK